MCLKGRPDLADDDEIEQLKETVIRLERDIEIPNFAGLDELVQSFSDFTNLLHHPRHVGYIDFICESIAELETIILNPKSAALSRRKSGFFGKNSTETWKYFQHMRRFSTLQGTISGQPRR